MSNSTIDVGSTIQMRKNIADLVMYNRKYRRHDRDEEEYEHRAKGKAKEQGDMDRHWDCPFFKHCWNSGMSRLPTIDNCPECSQRKEDKSEDSVFNRLGPLPPQNKRAESSQGEYSEELEV